MAMGFCFFELEGYEVQKTKGRRRRAEEKGVQSRADKQKNGENKTTKRKSHQQTRAREQREEREQREACMG